MSHHFKLEFSPINQPEVSQVMLSMKSMTDGHANGNSATPNFGAGKNYRRRKKA